MPIYPFKCIGNHEFDELKAFSDGDTTVCPECGKTAHKQFGASNWTFGWRLSESSHIKGNHDQMEKDI
jgi:putative FmdB family regulatory protein